ncbi:MAG: putative Ig domain-containing protein [Bryobacterales bacterium]|nr:putative Ig domain-containing protein [Bryobacterales bacterium]
MMRLRFFGFALAMLALPAAAQVTLSSSPTPLPAGTVGVAYPAASITASGGTAPYSYLVTSSSPNILPPGLSLATSGALSGTPSSAGTFTFTVTATDSTAGTALTGSQSFSITINPAPSITTSTLPAWSAGATTPYSQTLAATGGTGALTYSLTGGSLPTGLSLSSGGAITGTPSAAGTANFTVTVTDSLGATGSKLLSITINAAPTISTASPLPSGAQTIAYSTSLAATGGTGARSRLPPPRPSPPGSLSRLLRAPAFSPARPPSPEPSTSPSASPTPWARLLKPPPHSRCPSCRNRSSAGSRLPRPQPASPMSPSPSPAPASRPTSR